MNHPQYLRIDLFTTVSSMVALPGEMKNGYEWRKPLDWAAWLATIASLVIAAGAARMTINQIYEDRVTSRNAQSCSLAWSTVGDTTTFQGFAYYASGTNLDCKTLPVKGAILSEVERCAERLWNNGVVHPCCKLDRGGPWTLRLSSVPDIHVTHLVDCGDD